MTSISVVTPSFNYGRFLEDAIASVEKQEVDFEHIVQDACSQDETLEVLRRHGSRLKWVSEPDAGQSDAFNSGFARASGKWVSWLNADEFYFPSALKTLIGFGERGDFDVVYGDAVFVDENGRMLRLLGQHPFRPFLLRWYGCFISTCAVLFRRPVLGEAPLNVDAQRLMDWELFLRLAKDGARIGYVPYPVGAFRIHSEQVTSKSTDAFAREYRFLEKTYGVKSRSLRTLGRVLHGIEKGACGSMARQYRARPFRGQYFGWFGPRDGENVTNFLQRVYPASGEINF